MLNTASKHILIIEDALDTQALLKLLLESKGYVVECTGNGAEALHLLNSSDNLPDMILVDLNMPVMDGFEFLGAQSESSKLKGIPTVLISADGDRSSTREDSRASEILTKPFNVADLIDVIERCCVH